MQARKDSREPLNKRPFDLQEAVVLLDVYLDMIKNGTSIMKAAEKASVRLRSLAKRNGYVISDSYRSAGGLVNLLREHLCLLRWSHSTKTAELVMKKS